jgi:tetratricopeptide (TPR) repeat protein
MRARVVMAMCVGVTLLPVDVAHGAPRTKVVVGEATEPQPRKSTKLRDKRARAHLAAGWAYYNDGEWDRAIEEWRKGALIEPSPVWNWNFGQANRQAGRFEKARWNYERFIAEASDVRGAEEAIANARRFIEEIDTAKSSPPRGPVEEPSAPPVAAAPLMSTPPPLGPWAKGERWSDDWLGWSLLGAGVLGGAVGTGLLWHAAALEDEAADERNHERRLARLDDADGRRQAGVVTLVACGGVAVSGLVKLAIGPDRAPTGIARYVYAGPSWVGLRISFR